MVEMVLMFVLLLVVLLIGSAPLFLLFAIIAMFVDRAKQKPEEDERGKVDDYADMQEYEEFKAWQKAKRK